MDRLDEIYETALITLIEAVGAGDEQLTKLAKANAILVQVARGYQRRAFAAEAALVDVAATIESSRAAAQQGN